MSDTEKSGNIENLSTNALTSIAEKYKKAIDVTESKIDITRREGKLARDERYLNAVGSIKCLLIKASAYFIIIFFICVFLAGLTPSSYSPNTKGWEGLESLFFLF